MLVLSDLPNNFYAAYDKFIGQKNMILSVTKVYQTLTNPIPHPSKDNTILESVSIISVEKSKDTLKDSIINKNNSLEEFKKVLKETQFNDSKNYKSELL